MSFRTCYCIWSIFWIGFWFATGLFPWVGDWTWTGDWAGSGFGQ